MKFSGTRLFGAILALSAAGALSAESINPPTMPQTAPMNKQEKKNLDMVLDWWRVVIQGGHLDQTPKYQAEDYIQHNPNVPSTRDGFVAFFKDRAKPEPIKPEWKNTPELIVVSGNMVLYMMERYSTDPADASKIYKWNWFDMVRVDDGLIQEHWDMAMKTPPPANVPKPAQ